MASNSLGMLLGSVPWIAIVGIEARSPQQELLFAPTRITAPFVEGTKIAAMSRARRPVVVLALALAVSAVTATFVLTVILLRHAVG